VNDFIEDNILLEISKITKDIINTKPKRLNTSIHAL